jgi:hypothetical protein
VRREVAWPKLTLKALNRRPDLPMPMFSHSNIGQNTRLGFHRAMYISLGCHRSISHSSDLESWMHRFIPRNRSSYSSPRPDLSRRRAMCLCPRRPLVPRQPAGTPPRFVPLWFYCRGPARLSPAPHVGTINAARLSSDLRGSHIDRL